MNKDCVSKDVKSGNRVRNDFKNFGCFIQHNILKLIIIELVLLATSFSLYFSTVLISKNLHIVVGYLLLSLTIILFVFLLAFTYFLFARLNKDKTTTIETNEAICFYSFFSSLFLDGAFLTIFFLIFKAINPNSVLLIQNLTFIISLICVFLFFGLSVYSSVFLKFLAKKKGDVKI